ncbi:MAG: thiamine phosphate synthase, partial [Polyangiaceae bacterium]|nr:thiamine phosphate synthase [Polyangiaceae bacterium]
VGITRLRAVVDAVPLPVVGIGGITAASVADVAATGAQYWAAISALSGAHDIRGAARALQGGGR